MWGLFKKKVERTLDSKKAPEVTLPDIAKTLGIRMNGVINLRIGVSSFFLLNDEFLSGGGTLIDTYIIRGVSVIDMGMGFMIVRVVTSNGMMFQFNCPEGKLNDIILFTPFEGAINLVTTEALDGTMDTRTVLRATVDGKTADFDQDVDLTLRECYTSSGNTKTTTESLYVRQVRDLFEYFLKQTPIGGTVVNTKHWLGVVINEADIEVV